MFVKYFHLIFLNIRVFLRLPLAKFWAQPRKLNILPMTGTYFPSYVIPGYLPGRANSADVLRHLHFGAFYFFVKFARPKNLVLGFALRSTCHHHRPSTIEVLLQDEEVLVLGKLEALQGIFRAAPANSGCTFRHDFRCNGNRGGIRSQEQPPRSREIW